MAAQKTYISEVLEKIIKHLEREWDKHKEKFRMDKLISCFPNSLGYPIKKLFERISNKDLASLGKLEISEIRKAPQCFLEALSRRGLDLEPYRYTTGPIEHALDRLEHFFEYAQTGEDCLLDEEDARIFAFFVEKKISELKEIAQEIDEQYSD